MIKDQQKDQTTRCMIAVENAKKRLTTGDKLRVTKCPGRKRTVTFDRWDGDWIVSISGINDYHPVNVDRLNGVSVDFTK